MLHLIIAIGIGILAPGSLSAAAAPTGVDDFHYSSWSSRFEVSLDDDRRARLHVTETLVAEFPDVDQNRGIVRGFAEYYEDAPLRTEVLSVRDETGAAVPFELEEDDDNDMLFVLVGDDEYQHGPTTYVIEYTMSDVVIAATATEVDEFYWDLLPLDSTQSITEFSAEIVFADELAEALIPDAASCYQGREGSAQPCAPPGLQGPRPADGGAVFTIVGADVAARSGITVAIGLEPGTVVQPSQRTPSDLLELGPLLLGGASLLLVVASRITRALFVRRSRRGTGIVIAQFDVPDSMPPLLAATLLPKPKNVIPAEIVHQAVRGMLKIHDREGSPTLRRVAGIDAPDPLDAVFHQELFRDADSDGDITIPTASASFGTRMRRLTAHGRTAASSRGLLREARSPLAVSIFTFAVLFGAAGVALGLWGVAFGRPIATGAFIAALVAAVIALIIGAKAVAKTWVPTPAGALEYEYLLGVREFIRVAEADRLRMLQSYTGADRRSDGSIDVVHLYERLLPYAMLFGLEREWGRVLEITYTSAGHTASWTTTPPVRLAPAMAAFAKTTSTSAAYRVVSSSSSSSSSSGGSGGGGFSGGGGGGGFSGGR